jgi:streptomycin 6-kinase
MHGRRRAHDDRRAVLVHGDVHDLNALQAADGTFKLVDPAGLRAEPACDLGTIVRCNPDSGDDLLARAERLTARTAVDANAIWEWGTIHRVVSGLYSRSIGFQPFGDLLLAEADRLMLQPLALPVGSWRPPLTLGATVTSPGAAHGPAAKGRT